MIINRTVSFELISNNDAVAYQWVKGSVSSIRDERA